MIYGARRVGKTTLLKQLEKQYRQSSLYLNCDEPDIRASLSNKTSTELVNRFGDKKLIFIDEAQRVRNIGLTIKLVVDNAPHLQIVATGSSSFELSNTIKEPLTGRAYEFHLMPLSLSELDLSPEEISRHLEKRLIYGMYPEVVLNETTSEEQLKSIYRNYLYKDALEYQQLKNPELIENLLAALALQIGNEVSFTELGSLLSVDQKTIGSYVRILELAFVIFRLPPLSRNLRKEIAKSRKIYFWDTGIRNAIINNFNPFTKRADIGGLWENFVIAERLKRNMHMSLAPNTYFWRTWTRQEVDYIEEAGGALTGFEIKWRNKPVKAPSLWHATYPESTWQLVNPTNFLPFVG